MGSVERDQDQNAGVVYYSEGVFKAYRKLSIELTFNM